MSVCACPYAVTSAVTKETPWGGEEVPKGVRHGKERHVVHSLSLEKSLSEIHRLILSLSHVHEMSSSRLGATARWTLPPWRRRGDFITMELSLLLPLAQRGFRLLCFPFPNKEKTKLVGKKKQKDNQQEKKRTFTQAIFF